MNKQQKLLEDFRNKKVLKVISGIRNFDFEKVMKLVNCSEYMGATVIDICAKPFIVEEARKRLAKTMLCVSSIDVAELIEAERLGADMLELGNYEAFYEEGIYFTAEQVFDLAAELVNAAETALISVTIPGYLDVASQVALAVKLESIGVDIVQTEGAVLVEAKSPSALGQIEKARLTLANTIELAKTLEHTAIITASAMTPDTVKLAMAAGASGVGVGKYLNRLDTEIEICAAIGQLQESIKIFSKENTKNQLIA